ncbi:MAG: TonB family protein [Acidobacteria bacterium]|nr:TonB family protein [Acidobacteriota bacterium]
MEVTDVLRGRMEQPGGFQTMVAVSGVLHAAAIGALLLAPRGLLQRASEPDAPVMTISLGGGEGPRNGGITPMGGRAVQAEAPPEAPRQTMRPPAARTPLMELPLPKARTVKPAPKVAEAPDSARGRTPSRGKEAAAGSSPSETGARGQGFGLSTGGGPGAGSTIDAINFCCPDYIVQMLDRIRSNWVQRAESAGTNTVKFTIQRDGRIADVVLEKSSGYSNLDLASQRALLVTRTLNPLPAGYPNPSLTMHLNFEYVP